MFYRHRPYLRTILATKVYQGILARHDLVILLNQHQYSEYIGLILCPHSVQALRSE